MNFHTNLEQPDRIGVFALPEGRVREIRMLIEGATTELDGESRPGFFIEHCSDARSPSGLPLSVLRVLPTDPEGFEVLAGRTTVATVELKPSRDFIIVRHSDSHPYPTPGAASGDKIGHSKLFVRPDLFASHVVLEVATEPVLANEFFVGYKKGSTAEQISEVNAKFKAFVKVEIPDVPAQWIRITVSATPEEVLSYYAGNEHVEFVQPVYRPQLFLAPNDPSFSAQYEKQKIEAEAAWDKGTGSRSITVAIVDTGIDLGHGELLSNTAINQAEIPAAVKAKIQDQDGDPALVTFVDLNDPANNDPTICKKDNSPPNDVCDPRDLVNGVRGDIYGWQDGLDNDDNGLPDDLFGWDFTPCGLNQNQTDVMPGCGDNLPDDDYGHGTAVAGIVGADTNNSIGVCGTAWRVGLVSYRVLDPLGGKGGTSVHSWAGVKFAAKAGHPLINMSAGGVGYAPGTSVPGDCTQDRGVIKAGNLAAMVEQDKKVWKAAEFSGSLLVNSVVDCSMDFDNYEIPGQVYVTPAALTLSAGFENIIAVTSSDATDTIKQAKGGKLVDIVAPGENLTIVKLRATLSSVPEVTSECAFLGKNVTTLPCSGTSFAAPQVAGAAALLIAQDGSLRNNPVEIKARLKAASNDIFEGKGGAGLLSMKKLLNP